MAHRSPDAYAARLNVALNSFEAMRPRSMQRELGVSSVGGCRSEALFRLTGAPASDAPRSRAALHGTASHELYGRAMAFYDPNLIVEPEVKVTMPSGLVIVGHPDWIDPAEPSCTDLKTVADEAALHAQRKLGSSEQQRFQRHLYGLGAIQAGLVAEEGLIVRNVWIDRAGQSDEPFIEQEPFDMAVIHAADSWLADLAYAAEHGDEVPRDRHYEWCRDYCPFFTRCRSGEAGGELVVTDPDLLRAAENLYEGRQVSRGGDLLEKAGKAVLAPLQQNAEGDVAAFILGDYRLRWSWVNRSDGASHWKAHITKVEEG